jgi:hypothetical protein
MRARDGESTRTTAGARTPSIRSAAVVDVTPLVQRAVAVQREVTDDKDFAAAAGDPTDAARPSPTWERTRTRR